MSATSPTPCIPRPLDVPEDVGIRITKQADCVPDKGSCSYCSSDPDIVGPERAELSAVMAYEHPELVHRLVEKEGLSPSDAWTLFEDMKRFLWLSANSNRRMAPTERLDIAWHNFILFTRDYADFCNRYFGHFLHHQPRLRLSENKTEPMSAMETAEFAKQVFGNVSQNWLSAPTAGCSMADCSPAYDCS